MNEENNQINSNKENDLNENLAVKNINTKQLFSKPTISDIVAIFALIISLVSLSWNNLSDFLSGSKLVVLQPGLIELRCDQWYKKSDVCLTKGNVTATAILSFVNESEYRNEVVKNAVVNVEFGNNNFDLTWQYFTQFHQTGIGEVTPAKSIIIPSQSAESQEVQFFPREINCVTNDCSEKELNTNYYKWSDLTYFILAQQTNIDDSYIKFEFITSLFNENVPGKISCKGKITNKIIRRIKSNKNSFVLSCW